MHSSPRSSLSSALSQPSLYSFTTGKFDSCQARGEGSEGILQGMTELNRGLLRLEKPPRFTEPNLPCEPWLGMVPAPLDALGAWQVELGSSAQPRRNSPGWCCPQAPPWGRESILGGSHTAAPGWESILSLCTLTGTQPKVGNPS